MPLPARADSGLKQQKAAFEDVLFRHTCTHSSGGGIFAVGTGVLTGLRGTFRNQWALAPLVLTLALGTASAQTTIERPGNNYSPAEDVDLGREPAAAIRKQLPILNDGQVEAYVEEIGRRLVESIPTDFQQPGFEYTFTVLNVNELTSVALPGGPVFISRGMIEAAETEGALAGLIAHQLGHVVLRHATAQASRGERYQIGAIAGRSIGAIVGGAGTGIIAQGTNYGISTYYLMYEHEFERQADLVAARLLAFAGYDPRDLAIMFDTIQARGAGRGGPQWMMSHPNPGDRKPHMNRGESIDRAADMLRFEGIEGIAETLRIEGAVEAVAMARLEGTATLPDALESIQARLADLPARPAARAHRAPIAAGGYGVAAPSGESEQVTAGDLLQLSVPANWRRVAAGNTVMFAPEGAFVDSGDGPAGFTHGVQVAVARSLTGNLERDTQALLESFGQASPRLQWTPAFQRATIGGRPGLTTTMTNVSAVTGEFELVSVSTALLPDGSLLYVIGLAPQDEAGTYRSAFNRVLESLVIPKK